MRRGNDGRGRDVECAVGYVSSLPPIFLSFFCPVRVGIPRRERGKKEGRKDNGSMDKMVNMIPRRRVQEAEFFHHGDASAVMRVCGPVGCDGGV